MKFLLFQLLLILITYPVFAQSATFQRTYGEYTVGEKVYLFGERVYLRDAPSIAAEVIGRLPIAHEVEIKAIGDLRTFNGFELPWIKVEAEYNDQLVSGWLWSGLLSMFARESDSGNVFLLGVKRQTDDAITVEVRVAKDNRLVDQLSFAAIGEKRHHLEFPVSDGKGLETIQHILQPTFIYQADGYTNGEVTLLWDGEKLFNIGKTTNWDSSGKGYTAETYVFPTDEMGRSGQILLVAEKGKEDGLGNIKFDQTTSGWRWDGAKLIKVKDTGN